MNLGVVSEVSGKCECAYDTEEVLKQVCTTYITALVVEVGVLGPLARDDPLALARMILGIVEALSAAYICCAAGCGGGAACTKSSSR